MYKRQDKSSYSASDASSGIDTLINRLKRYLYEKGEYNPDDEHQFAPALANRLDRNTCGIVIAAKNAEALRILNEKIKLREIDKFYLCIVHGTPIPASAVLTAYLIKNSSENRVYISDSPVKDAQMCIRDSSISIPNPLFPARASPLSFISSLLYIGFKHLHLRIFLFIITKASY